MPMDDSLSLLSRNFEEYKKEKEEKEKAAAPPPPRVITPPPAVRAPPPAPAPPAPAPKPNFIPPDQRMKYLLNLLSDSRYLNLLELDEIGDYVSLRRKRILADQEDRGTPAPASSAATPRAQSGIYLINIILLYPLSPSPRCFLLLQPQIHVSKITHSC